MRSFSIERQRTSDRASKPQAGTPDIGAQPDPTPAVSTIFGATHGQKLLIFVAMGGARPIPPARETGRPARRWLGPWFPGAPRAPGWLREPSSDGRGGRAGCARRLFRHALPEGVVARGFCETECASSRPYYRPDTTFAPVGTLSKSGRPFFEWVLPTLVINHLGHIREFFLLAVNHSSNHPRGPEHSIVRTPRIMLTAPGTRHIAKTGRFLQLRPFFRPDGRGDSRRVWLGFPPFSPVSRLSQVDASRKLTPPSRTSILTAAARAFGSRVPDASVRDPGHA